MAGSPAGPRVGEAPQQKHPARRHEEKQPLRLHGRTADGDQDMDLGASLRLDAFGVDSAYNYSVTEMLLAGNRKLPHIDLGAELFSMGSSSSNSVGGSTSPSLPDS